MYILLFNLACNFLKDNQCFNAICNKKVLLNTSTCIALEGTVKCLNENICDNVLKSAGVYLNK